MRWFFNVFFRATSCTLRGNSTSVRNELRSFLCVFFSCNKLHATILLFSTLLMAHASQRVPITDWYKRHALGNARYQKGVFHIVACILMHDRITRRTLFNPFGHSRFRATSCTLRSALFHMVACILMHEWFHLGAEWSAVIFERVFWGDPTLRRGFR